MNQTKLHVYAFLFTLLILGLAASYAYYRSVELKERTKRVEICLTNGGQWFTVPGSNSFLTTCRFPGQPLATPPEVNN